MKKLFAILSCAVMLSGTFAFTACGNDNAPHSGEQGTLPAIPNGVTLNEITDAQEMYDTVNTFYEAIYGHRDENGNLTVNDFVYTLDCEYNQEREVNKYGKRTDEFKSIINSKGLLENGVGYGKSYSASETISKNDDTIETQKYENTIQLYENDYKIVENNYLDDGSLFIRYEKNVKKSESDIINAIMYRTDTQDTFYSALFHLYIYIDYIKSNGNIHDDEYLYGTNVVTMSCTVKADSTKLYLETEYRIDYDFNEDEVATAYDKYTSKLYLDIAPDLKKKNFDKVVLTDKEKQSVAYLEVKDEQQLIKDFKDGKTITLTPSGNAEAAYNVNAYLEYTYDGKSALLDKWFEGTTMDIILGTAQQCSVSYIEDGKLIINDYVYSKIIKDIGEDFDESKLTATLYLHCGSTTLGIDLF